MWTNETVFSLLVLRMSEVFAFRVPSIRFVPAHLTPRYPVLRPGEDIIREKQQIFVLINTISFRARDVDSELVYRNG